MMTYDDMTQEALPRSAGIVQFPGRVDLGTRIGAELRGYWEALRRGQDLPCRSDVDPRGIERALPYAFILERVAPGVARFRIAGRHLNALLGMEVRGMPLTVMFAADGRQRACEAIESVFAEPAIVTMALRATGTGRADLPGSLLLLPLRSDFGDVSRALGCLVTENDLGHAPHRFRIDTIARQSLDLGTPHIAHRAPAAPRNQPGITADRAETGRPIPNRAEAGQVDRNGFGLRQPGRAQSPEERRRLFQVISSSL